jgi:hypothetical protein
MWIVRLALRRPYTVLVAVLAVLLFGALSIQRLKRDILPNIDIPVVVVVWTEPLPPGVGFKRSGAAVSVFEPQQVLRLPLAEGCR